jgi:hypothetical protein
MEPDRVDRYNGGAVEERPSEGFIRAVAELLETDAEDILTEMGYVYGEAVVRQRETADV